MTKRNPRRRARGFTLIELMVVVAIVGVLASIAIPVSTRMTLRAKQAERNELMMRVKAGVLEYYVQKGATGHLVADWQPPLPPQSTKRPIDFNSTDWSKIFPVGEEIVGNVYYSFHAEAWDAAGTDPAKIEVQAVGDLDGDGYPSTAVMTFVWIDGAFVLDPAQSSFDTDGDVF